MEGGRNTDDLIPSTRDREASGESLGVVGILSWEGREDEERRWQGIRVFFGEVETSHRPTASDKITCELQGEHGVGRPPLQRQEDEADNLHWEGSDLGPATSRLPTELCPPDPRNSDDAMCSPS